MLWQIGVLAASLALVVIAGFMIPAIREARRTLRETANALGRLQARLEQTAEETDRLLRLTHQAVSDVHNKIKAADAFVEAIGQTGEAAHRVSGTVKLVSQSLADALLQARGAMRSQQDTLRDLLELAAISMQMWQRWHTSKASAKTADAAGEQIKREMKHDGSE